MASPEALADGEAAGHMDVKKAGNPDFTGVSGLLRIAPDSILVEPGGIEPPSASPLQSVLHT